jgi:hypothetical protein
MEPHVTPSSQGNEQNRSYHNIWFETVLWDTVFNKIWHCQKLDTLTNGTG